MSSNNFGLRIGIEGEREFKKALSEINRSFKVLGSEMQLVTSQFDKNDKSSAALTAQKGVLNKEIEAQKNKIDTLKSALENASDSFGENDRRTQNWQIALNKAQAELNHMKRELGQTEKALDDVGNEKSSNLGREVANTGDIADDAGGRFEKLGDILKGIGVALGCTMAAIVVNVK